MENPFKTGEVVIDGLFCNRVKEIKTLQAAFKDSQNIVVISPRRWGKSSMVKQAIKTYKGKVIVVEIDLFGITSKEEFLDIYLRQILEATRTRFKDITTSVGKWLKSVTPYISFTVIEGIDMKIGVTLPKDEKHIDEILKLPQLIAKDKEIPVVICLDEFQKMNDWKEGKLFLEKLRAVWQLHHKVSYCLYGSKRHIMTEMFNSSSLPFYKFGETIFLQKIAPDEWVKFIIDAFKGTKKFISPLLAGKVTKLVENHPYYIQWLCRVIWINTDKEVTERNVDEGYEDMLTTYTPLFLNQTYNLSSKQINYLKAFVSGETQFSSQRVLEKFNLGSPGNIQRVEKALEDAEILLLGGGGSEFSEPYFKPLFKRKFNIES